MAKEACIHPGRGAVSFFSQGAYVNIRWFIFYIVTSGFCLARAAEPVRVTLYAGSDATIKSTAPGSNFGTDAQIQWSCTSTSPYAGNKCYFRFRLPKDAAGYTTAATLKLTRSGVSPWNTRARLYVLNDNAAGQNWTESAITWNNAPANTLTDYGFDTNQASYITQVNLLGWKNAANLTGEVWAVSNGVANVLNADTDQLVTFMVEWALAPYSVGESFAAKEHTTLEGPVLEITYDAPGYEANVKTLATQKWHAWRKKQSQFPSAAWSYFNNYSGSQDEYQVYKDAGLNLVQSPYAQCNTATNVTGLNLLLGSWESIWKDPVKLTHYIDYPVPGSQQVAGYLLYDEPPATSFPQLAAAAEMIYRLDDKDALPIIDHLPNWAVEYDRFGLGATNGTFYETYINKFMEDVSPCVMLNCHYPVLADGSDRPQYYDNIEFFRRLALKYDIGLMGFALVNGHTPYREPSESDLNWMVYSYLAYGAQGMFYYNYRIMPDSRFAEGLVTYSNGTPRTTYYMAQTLNAGLDKLWPVLKQLKSTAVFHTGTTVPAGTVKYTNGASAAIATFTGTNCILGEFVNWDHRADDSLYVMVVNKNHGGTLSSAASSATVAFTPNSSYPYVSLISSATGEEILQQSVQGTNRLTLGGGKGALLRFAPAFPSAVTIMPVLDTYIDQGSSNTDFSAGTVLIAQNSTQFPDRNRKIYMKFLLPTNRPADGAAFEIFPASIYTNQVWTYEIYGLKDTAPGNGWTSITWNNAPANNSESGYLFTADATGVLGQITRGGVTGVNRTATSPALNEFIRSDLDGTVTLMMVRISNSSANDTWASCEAVGFIPPRLKLTYSPLSTWALGYGLYDPDAGADADPDGDGASNFYEFVFGGDPTNANFTGHAMTGRVINSSGTNWIELVHARRSGVGLMYAIEESTNLISGNWTTNGWVVVGPQPAGEDFGLITNRSIVSPLFPARFFRIRVTDEQAP